MKPIDFVVFDGGSSPNMPVHEVAEAMSKPIKVHGCDGEYFIVGYYFSDGVMNIDITSIYES